MLCSHDEFSGFNRSMSEFIEDVAIKKELLSAPPFPDSEMTAKAVESRIQKVYKDYWYFDKTYFPAEMYSGGHYKASDMHKAIVELAQTNGVHIVFGPRGHGKTVTAKKILIWLFITGAVRLAGTYSETIDKARNILADTAELIEGNDRIMNDFKAEFKVSNSDKLQFRFNGVKDRRYRYIQAFSEGRSVRGYGRQFDRPQLLIGDDVETLESSMQPEIVEKRVEKLAESFMSLSETKRTFLILGNDFSRSSALHRIKLEQENGILSPAWRVWNFQAWDEAKQRPMWHERYKAKSEAELKVLLQAKSESDWQANFQQNPVPPEGFVFQSDKLAIWDTVPTDARGVVYCDPNLSKKSMGDTTGMTALKFSPSTQKFYVVAIKCKSYSDSIKLLDDLHKMVYDYGINAIGMDGHVTQESIWSDNMRHWSRQKGRPFPKTVFCRFHIDDLVKNVQMAWTDGDILFPPDIRQSDEGKRYLDQLFAFRGKKANKTDDAPDSLIGAYAFAHERHYVRRGKNLLAMASSMISDGNFRF